MWVLLKNAPVEINGHLWCRELHDRTDIIGAVHQYQDRAGRPQRLATSPHAKGYEFTHWHPLPKPPGRR